MDGIILINKEKDYTSHDVVNVVKKITRSKVGHTGTLDPNATGVLPLLLGNATKISKYLIKHNKEYEVVLQLGIKTTTADIEGEIIEKRIVNDTILKIEYIEQILEKFKGKQMQVPPAYSAIKVNGKKLYSYARAGIKIEIQPRQIEIYNIEILDINIKEKQIKFKVMCSKGTYIRSLCEDIAEKLGNIGYMKELNRIKVGEFSINDAIRIEELKEKICINDLSNIITIEEMFRDLEKIDLPESLFFQYLNGVKLYRKEEDGVYRIYVDKKFTGLGIIEQRFLKRDIIV